MNTLYTLRNKCKLLMTVVAMLILTLHSNTSWSQTIFTEWNFDNLTVNTNVPNPAPSTGLGSSSIVGSMGTSGTANVNGISATCTNATGSNYGWNISTANPGATNESSGVQFMVSTVGFTGIQFAFSHRVSNASTRTVRIQYTINGTTWVNFDLNASNYTQSCANIGGLDNGRIDAHSTVGTAAGDTWKNVTLIDFSSVSAANNNANFGVRIVAAHYTTTGQFRRADNSANVSSGGAWRFDNVTFSGNVIAGTPNLDASESSLSDFAYTEGSGPSAFHSFTLNGTDLTSTGNIVVSAPANYSVSLNSASGYGSTVNVPYTGGVITGQPVTVYVRLNGSLAAACSYTGIVNISGGGATDVDINVSGFVDATLNPPLHNLGVSGFSFTEWDNSNACRTYPSNMRFWRAAATATNPNVTPAGNYTGLYNVGSASRINGLGANGVSFVATGSEGQGIPLGAVVGLNATNRENIQVNWTGGLIAQGNGSPVPREFRLRLQYRIGTGTWFDVPGPVEYSSAGKSANDSEGFSSTLPSACNDEPEVYVRWVYYEHAANDGNQRPEIRLDEVSISSSVFGSPDPEPTNFPTAFACGTATTSSIQLSWTGSTGANLPSGYLLKWSDISFAAIAAPVDGTPESGAGIANVSHSVGLNSYNVTGLSEGTTYYFKIWPYSNSGPTIDYKLGAQPQTSCNSASNFTLPPLHDLGGGNYTFNAWASNATIGTYPNNMRLHYIASEQTGVQTANLSTFDYSCGYDLTGRPRFTGEGENGIAMVNTGNSQFNNCASGASDNRFTGVMLVGLNTTGQSNIGVQWTGRTINNNSSSRDYRIILQYRIGNSGTWTTVNNAVSYRFNNLNLGNNQNNNNGDFANFNQLLPAACNNQAEVYVRWLYYNVSGANTRPLLAVDDIVISPGASPCTVTPSSSLIANAGNSSVNLLWNNGTCLDEIIIVGREGSAVAISPTGDGSTYTPAIANFSSGYNFGSNQYLLFKGSANNLNVTGLTNGNTYHFTIYARRGTTWSSPISVSATPTAPQLVINEIAYINPGSDNEWIEILNRGNVPITLTSDFSLQNTSPVWTYTFDGSVTINPNQVITVKIGDGGSFPFTPTIVAFASGTDRLNNTSSTITILNNAIPINQVAYQSSWFTEAANGSSLQLTNPNAVNFSDVSNWCASSVSNYRSTPNQQNNCFTQFYSTGSGQITDQIWAATTFEPPLNPAPVFNQNTSIIIRNGHSVSLNPLVTPSTINNLTINTGGRLWRDVSLVGDGTESEVTNKMRYINITGPSIIVNGTLGNPNVNIIDLLGINLSDGTFTISGNGIVNIGRIRKDIGTNVTNLIFDINARLGFNGTVIYNNVSATNSEFNVTINASKTVSSTYPGLGALSISGIDGTITGTRKGGYTINGTVNTSKFFARSTNNGVYTTIGATGRLNVNDIIIQTQTTTPAVTTPFNINANGVLNITKDGKLTLNSGALETNGGLNVSDGAIVLHGAGTPGLLNEVATNITGNATVRRQGEAFSLKYNYWSSPVQGAYLSSITGFAGPIWNQNAALNLYYYQPASASSATAQGLLNGWISTTPSAEMDVAKGYITTGANLAGFTGVLNNGNLSYTLEGGTHTNMNLIGNPYPSGIDAAAFLSNIDNAGKIEGGTLYLWTDDGSNGGDYTSSDYVSFDGDDVLDGEFTKNQAFDLSGRIINVAQGFVILAEESAVGQEINFYNSMRSNNTGMPFLQESERQRVILNLTNQHNVRSQFKVAFREEATDGYDVLYDAKKLMGNPNVAIYSIVEGKNLLIDSYKDINTSRVIDLGITAKVSGLHTIDISKIVNIDPTVLIFIENIETGEFHNLRKSPFTFEGGASVVGHLFRLHFREPVNVAVQNESCKLNDGSITINTPFSGWDYRLKNSEGNIVFEALNHTGENIISHLEAGNYTLEMTYEDGYDISEYYTIEAVTPVNAEVAFSSTELTISNATIEVLVNSENVNDISIEMGDGTLYSNVNFVQHTYQQVGIYDVVVTVGNATCTETFKSQVKVSEITTGIQSLANNQIAIFPNPAKETVNLLINIPANVEALNVNILDINGRKVFTHQINPKSGFYNEAIDVSALSSGVYQINVQGNDFNAIKKLIIQK